MKIWLDKSITGRINSKLPVSMISCYMHQLWSLYLFLKQPHCHTICNNFAINWLNFEPKMCFPYHDYCISLLLIFTNHHSVHRAESEVFHSVEIKTWNISQFYKGIQLTTVYQFYFSWSNYEAFTHIYHTNVLKEKLH